MVPLLRIDLKQRRPWRLAPELLFGEVRRKARWWGGTAGAALALVLVGSGWLAGGGSLFLPTVGETVNAARGKDPMMEAASGTVAPPAADEFPLMPEEMLIPALEGLPEPPPLQGDLLPLEPGESATPVPDAVEPLAVEGAERVGAPPAAPEPRQSAPPADAAGTVSSPAGEEAVRSESASPRASSARETAPETGARYSLQLGTYRFEESAQQDQTRFRALGIEARIYKLRTYFVLRLPPFASRGEAERVMQELRAQGIDTVLVSPRRR